MADVLGVTEDDRERFDIDISSDGTVWYYNGDSPEFIGENQLVRISPSGEIETVSPSELGVEAVAGFVSVGANSFLVSLFDSPTSATLRNYASNGEFLCGTPPASDHFWYQMRPLGGGDWALRAATVLGAAVSPSQYVYAGPPCGAESGAVLVSLQEDDELLGFEYLGGRYVIGGTRQVEAERRGFIDVFEPDGALRSSWSAADEPTLEKFSWAGAGPGGTFALPGLPSSQGSSAVGLALLDAESGEVEVRSYSNLRPPFFSGHVQLMLGAGDPWLLMGENRIVVATLPDGEEPCCPVELEGWPARGVVDAHRVENSVVAASVDRREFGDDHADVVIVRFDPT